MKFPHDVQSVKIYEDYFQSVIDGEKPFEIRKDDGEHIYLEGEKFLLREIKKEEHFEECPLHRNCPYIDDVKEEYFEYGEEEARDICEESRADCDEHTLIYYTGRWCLVKIKKIFRLDKIGLAGYVAFTFEILDKGKENESCERIAL